MVLTKMKILNIILPDNIVGRPIMNEPRVQLQVYNAKRFNVDMSQFPTITRLEARLSKLPAFAAAHPSMQQDCPEELK